jgi:hypothetical protein
MTLPAALLRLTGGLVSATPLAAQNPRFSLAVQLSPDSTLKGARKPRVQVRDLIADKRWVDALEQSFPVRLKFTLEVWRSRDGWIDEFQRSVEWTTIIQREALQDQYRVTRIFLSGPEEFRFSTLEELDRWIRAPNEADVLPNGAGSFYYAVTLKISALTDDEMEELERFLAGEAGNPGRSERGSVGRGLKRFLLRLAGLPGEERKAQTGRFQVRR